MKNILCILAAAALFFLSSKACSAQVDSNAVKNADDFLAAVKIAEIPEGIQAVKQSAWSIDKLPVLQDYTKLYDGTFDTDVPNIKGFKRLVQAKVQSRNMAIIDTRYILISYQDHKSGQWRVYGFTELKDTTVESELSFFSQQLGNTQFVPAQFNYWHFAYWLGLSGKLKASQLASEKAITLNAAHPNPDFPSWRNDNVRIVKAIIGDEITTHFAPNTNVGPAAVKSTAP
ncbi:MAG: hypothetical protein ABSB84_08390 [Verrucomicrobiota bacterium]|jgi:hypothetical protein